MRVSVAATINYYYEVEVDDELCVLDFDGNLINERKLLDTCVDADPIFVDGADVSGYITSICNDKTGEELYVS